MKVAAVSLLLFLFAAAPAAADVSGPDIVMFLNAQRAAHGIPASITEDPDLSSACAKHNAYSERNGVLAHGENPGDPGYTAEGDSASKQAVLYSGAGPWSATNNPFETAPIHLAQLLAPRLDRMGASENGRYGCATTLASRNRPAPPANVTYTYPGDGTEGWFVSQLAAEGPYTPGETVGIAAGTKTGPYLYAFFDGPGRSVFDDATNAAASLVGPDGPVDVAVVDNTTPGLEGYLPTGMQVIPRSPLKPHTKYIAGVSANVEGRTFSHQWSFTTGERGRPFSMNRPTHRGRKVTLRFKAQSPLAVELALKREGRRTATVKATLGGSGTLTVKVPKRFGKRLMLVIRISVGKRTYTLRRAVRL